MRVLNPRISRWFEKRKIAPEAVQQTGIYGGKWAEREEGGKQVIPADDGSVIVFPYEERGREVNAKYRWEGKKFAQKAGGRKTFFNADVIDDAVADKAALVITEGEMDCLSVMTAGYKYAVSVPDGAPPARDSEGNLIAAPNSVDEVDWDHDDKYKYLQNNWERMAPLAKIVLATDDDEPGRRLAQELAVRLGKSRCYFIDYPDDEVVEVDGDKRPCKDLNEVLQYFGPARVVEIVSAAKPYPIAGLYKLSEIPEPPALQVVSTGFPFLDPHLMLYTPAFMVVTGVPGSGKTEFATQMMGNLALLHNWNIAIVSFEAEIKPFVRTTLRAVYLKKPIDEWNPLDKRDADAWIEKRFIFVTPLQDDENEINIDWLVDKVAAAVNRDGTRGVLIDPWNEIDYELGRMSLTEYTGKAIKSVKRLATKYNLLMAVCAHPTKEAAHRDPEKMSLMDVSDSAHWANKSDFGVILARQADSFATRTMVKVVKVKQQRYAGVPGTVTMNYSIREGRFQALDEDHRLSPYEPNPQPVVDDEDCPF